MIVYQLYWVVVDTVVLVYISCAEKKIRKDCKRKDKMTKEKKIDKKKNEKKNFCTVQEG